MDLTIFASHSFRCSGTMRSERGNHKLPSLEGRDVSVVIRDYMPQARDISCPYLVGSICTASGLAGQFGKCSYHPDNLMKAS